MYNRNRVLSWTKNRALGYTRVYRGRLRSGTIDNNRLCPVSKKMEILNPGIGFFL